MTHMDKMFERVKELLVRNPDILFSLEYEMVIKFFVCLARESEDHKRLNELLVQYSTKHSKVKIMEDMYRTQYPDKANLSSAEVKLEILKILREGQEERERRKRRKDMIPEITDEEYNRTIRAKYEPDPSLILQIPYEEALLVLAQSVVPSRLDMADKLRDQLMILKSPNKISFDLWRLVEGKPDLTDDEVIKDMGQFVGQEFSSEFDDDDFEEIK